MQRKEYLQAFIAHTNRNIFLTGKAGTGKTTLLHYIKEHTYKSCVIAAPTGIAALNAGGTTLHSLLQLPIGAFIPRLYGSAPVDAQSATGHATGLPPTHPSAGA